MIMYHGTTGVVALAALKEGLKPRSVTGSSNWEHCPSNPECVYITDVYGTYFANCASGKGEIDLLGVVEINTDLLDAKRLLPDEDYLEQATRKDPDSKIPDDWPIEQRTAHFRKLMVFNQQLFDHSVRGLGTAAHRGVIPPRAISRVSVVDITKNKHIALVLGDPTITCINHKLLSYRYKMATRWWMGDKVSLDDWTVAWTAPASLASNFDVKTFWPNEGEYQKWRSFWATRLGNRSGFVVKHGKAWAATENIIKKDLENATPTPAA